MLVPDGHLRARGRAPRVRIDAGAIPASDRAADDRGIVGALFELVRLDEESVKGGSR